ncbi:MAG: hypothetical protein U0271_36650 [Polyangiaceae bacterium]
MSFIEKLEALLGTYPADRTAVESHFDAKLRVDTRTVSPLLRVYRSFRSSPPVRSIELRVPFELDGGTPAVDTSMKTLRTDSFAILELDPRAAALTLDDIEEAFAPGRVVPHRASPELDTRALSVARGLVLFGFVQGAGLTAAGLPIASPPALKSVILDLRNPDVVPFLPSRPAQASSTGRSPGDLS